MSDSAIKAARRRRGAVRARLTRIERDIVKLEGKSDLNPNDERKIKRLTEQVKEDDKSFEERHLEVLDFIDEDQDTLKAEETICDEHGNRVMELLERLNQLEQLSRRACAIPDMAADPSSNFMKRVMYLRKRKDAIIESTRSLPSESEDLTRWLLQKCQEDSTALKAQLSVLVAEMLSSTGEHKGRFHPTSKSRESHAIHHIGVQLASRQHSIARSHRVFRAVCRDKDVSFFRIPKVISNRGKREKTDEKETS